MRLFCYLGIHSWSYVSTYWRECHHCNRTQRRPGKNGQGLKEARRERAKVGRTMKKGWNYTAN
jgi:hypothetical protein